MTTRSRRRASRARAGVSRPRPSRAPSPECTTHLDQGDATWPRDEPIRLARKIVAELFGAPHQRAFPVRYWDGHVESAADESPSPFTFVLRSPHALRRMLVPPTETRLAEAFLRRDFDIEGNLEAAAGLAVPLAERLRSPRRLVRLAVLLARLSLRANRASFDRVPANAHAWHRWRHALGGRLHSRQRDARAIKHHYDVGNEFYGLWLDRHRAYSCAYFPTGTESLDEAQEAKFELICRKLRLKPGERLLDIGCGWGALIRYATRHHGVTCVGVTLSNAQAAFARDRIADDGLGDRCTVELCDYRDIPAGLVFDKIVSVGMFEHVGADQLATYFADAYRLLKPGGLFLNHGIISLDDARDPRGASRPPKRLWGMGNFIDRYVFPDGQLVPLAHAVRDAEAAGLETRDVESLREHYAQTLRQWVRRLELRSTEARLMVGEETCRTWRLYMAASAQAFSTARIGIVQMLLARPDASGNCCHPPSRSDLYAGEGL